MTTQTDALVKLSRLLTIHALVTFAAGVVLIVRPGLIPGSVGIPLGERANLLCYLLGAAEISLAVLSYFSRNLSDRQALQLICLTFVVFHSVTALVEVYAFTQGINAKILGNVALRLIVTALFTVYGLQIRQKSVP